VEAGIDSISVLPDSVIQTIEGIADIEAKSVVLVGGHNGKWTKASLPVSRNILTNGTHS
jgi:hypothetical protein